MKNRVGFTLIELLVVIAIICILAAILFPVFASAREKARQSTCASNLKQMGLAFTQYNQDYDEAFPEDSQIQCTPGPCTGTNKNASGGTMTWEQLIYPYTESTKVYSCPDNINNKINNTGATNGMPAIPTSYGANTTGGHEAINTNDSFYKTYNTWGVFNTGSLHLVNYPGVPLFKITTPSEAIAIVETLNVSQSEYDLTNPQYAGLIGVACGANGARGTAAAPMTWSCLFAGHSGMSNYLFADGHVRALTPAQTIPGNDTTSYWVVDNTPLPTHISPLGVTYATANLQNDYGTNQ